MTNPLNYSKWDHIDSSSDEDESTPARSTLPARPVAPHAPTTGNTTASTKSTKPTGSIPDRFKKQEKVASIKASLTSLEENEKLLRETTQQAREAAASAALASKESGKVVTVALAQVEAAALHARGGQEGVPLTVPGEEKDADYDDWEKFDWLHREVKAAKERAQKAEDKAQSQAEAAVEPAPKPPQSPHPARNARVEKSPDAAKESDCPPSTASANLTTTSHRGSDRPHKEKPAAGMRNVSMFAPKPAPVPIVGPRITELPDDYEEETEPIPRIPFGRNRGLSSLSSMRMQGLDNSRDLFAMTPSELASLVGDRKIDSDSSRSPAGKDAQSPKSCGEGSARQSSAGSKITTDTIFNAMAPSPSRSNSAAHPRPMPFMRGHMDNIDTDSDDDM